MPDFTKLLDTDLADVKRPPAWPAGIYGGRILRYEPGESAQKKTPYMRFTVGITSYPEDFDDDQRKEFDIEGKTFRADYYLTEDAIWRLGELLKGLGFAGKMSEALPQTIGSEVKVDLGSELNQNTNEIFNRVNRLLPVE